MNWIAIGTIDDIPLRGARCVKRVRPGVRRITRRGPRRRRGCRFRPLTQICHGPRLTQAEPQKGCPMLTRRHSLALAAAAADLRAAGVRLPEIEAPIAKYAHANFTTGSLAFLDLLLPWATLIHGVLCRTCLFKKLRDIVSLKSLTAVLPCWLLWDTLSVKAFTPSLEVLFQDLLTLT